MKGVGIEPFLLRLEPGLQGSAEDFFQTDLLIIDIPPKSRKEGDDFHPAQIKAISDEIKKHKISHCLYVSSTSVYPNLEREVKEEDAGIKGGHAAISGAENILKSISGLNCTILRCGGLMGYDRIPGRYFAGQKNLTTGQVPVNYIHRDDVIGIITAIIRQNYWNETLNAVAPQHPTRQEVYEQNAREFDFEAPTFAPAEAEGFKVVSSDKLLSELNYQFLHPNPLEFPYSHS